MGSCDVGRRPRALGAGGGLGADPEGGTILDVSGPEAYDESFSAPVSIPPPLFFSFGIPPANSPPN